MDLSDEEGEIPLESSDEEGEIPLEYVDKYYFVDQNDIPITFSALPVKWQGQDSPGNSGVQVFLRGVTDCGNQRVFRRVTAWKFELSRARPEISVLLKDKNWVTLQKPRKSYETFIRTILITLHWLHFIKRNPEALATHVWNNLQKVFGSFEVQPSEYDLSDHMSLIGEAAKRDEDLVKSKCLLAFLERPSGAKSVKGEFLLHHQQCALTSKKSKFIVDEEEEEESSTEDDYEMNLEFDPVCSICDNGGSVLCCEGPCLRSFHATVAAGIETACESLGFTDESQVEALSNFLCDNCLYKQHQCYACGELGSSDESSSQEVFPCSAANCGHFYHPGCVSRLLHANDNVKSEDLEAKISMRESFYCPLHKCFVCNLSENKHDHDLHFAICRRCPRAYHRKCLPREITFQHSWVENKFQRAWEQLLPYNRILIYCLDHEIHGHLLTPARDHLIFPDVDGERRTRSQELPSIQNSFATFKRNISSTNSSDTTLPMKYPKHPERAFCLAGVSTSSSKPEKRGGGDDFDHSKKQKIDNVERKMSKEKTTSASFRSIGTEDDNLSLGTRKRSTVVGLPASRFTLSRTTTKKIDRSNPGRPEEKKILASRSAARVEMEKRITDLIDEVDSSFSFEEFIKSQGTPHIKSYRSGKGISKTITLGLVQTHADAARAALKMFDEGRSEDAKAVLDRQIFIQLMNLKKQLEIRLAPFLHGMRYTSFGRHFTKEEKLKEIVDRLHWYVQSGDMIIDFGCGSNDFSCLMKEKLEKRRKSCFFKNYDLIQPKNDFNFERRDWMSVNVEELADGSRLIMGLNPPFGYKAGLANDFIRKALEFRPKLLILIVPNETKRVDERAAYDLIWEDNQMLSGKPFYLPGSIDVNGEKLEQWNNRPTPLYLWSRCDWTNRHRAIALKHGHIIQTHHSAYNTNKNNDARIRNPSFNYTTEANHGVPETTDRDFVPFGGGFSGSRNTESEHAPEEDDGMCVDMDVSPITSPVPESRGRTTI